MKFTGERFIPDEKLVNDEIGYEHLHRYYAASVMVKGKSVLDIACGEGYGTNILAGQATFVAGVDIDNESIQHASSQYAAHRENLLFKCGGAEAIPFDDKTFEVVVSFETIEHLDPEAQLSFMNEIKRVLRPGGILIISTPDKKNYSDRYRHKNEFHLREFYKPEFIAFLKMNFSEVTLFDQGYEIVSIISNAESEQQEKINLYKWSDTGKETIIDRKYMIAIASNAAMPSSLNQFASVVPKVDKDFYQTMDRLISMNQEIEELGKWGTGMDRDLNKANASNEQLNKLINQHTDTFAVQNKNSHLLHELLEEKGKILASTDAKLLSLSNELNKQIMANEVVRTEQNNLLQKIEILEKNNDEKNQLVAGFEEQKDTALRQLKEKEFLLQDLRQKQHQLFAENEAIRMRMTEIYDSDGWRLLSSYYKLKGRLLPEHTKRYKALKKLFNNFHVLKNKLRSRKQTRDHFMPAQKKEFIPATVPVYELLSLPVFEHPLVSIIIPAFNGWEMNYQCIQSIINNTHGVAYEVILADDCSTDNTKECTSVIKNLRHIRNEKNLGFLINCKNAASTVLSKYLFFLNNDTTVNPNWLSSLVTLIENDPLIAMVGSKFIYPDGRLQEAGGIIWNDASGWNYGHNQDPTLPPFNYVKEVDYISGAGILIRKEAWEKTGGFDEQYSPAYCEDSDLAFAFRKMGYKVMYQPMSEIIHFEGYSHGTDNSLQHNGTSVKAYQKINNEKFFSKWKAILEEEQFPNAVNVFNARDRSRGKKTILVIDHYVPHFDKDAGSKTVFSYLKVFSLLGLNIKFIGDNFFKHEPYTSALQQMGIEVLYGNWFSENWREWIKENAEHIDFIYINRPHISIKYIDFIKEHTRAKILYYGHDLHFLREQKQYELSKDEKLLASAAKWEAVEKYLFEKSDIVLSPSESETVIIRQLNQAYTVETILPYFYNDPAKPIEDFSNRHRILFVGGFGHTPNLDAVMWFCENVWPIVLKSLPAALFTVVGSNPPDAVLQLENENIEIKGFVSEEELQSIYSATRVAVIPLRYGAGVKGKTVEAMYHGIPLVSTSFGLEGIPGNFVSNLPALDDAKSFAGEIIKLYSNNAALKIASSGEVNDINEFFTQQAAVEKMKKILRLK